MLHREEILTVLENQMDENSLQICIVAVRLIPIVAVSFDNS